MPNYKKMYFLLFNAATDALAALDKQNLRQASEILIQAQQRTEEMYVIGTEPP